MVETLFLVAQVPTQAVELGGEVLLTASPTSWTTIWGPAALTAIGGGLVGAFGAWFLQRSQQTSDRKREEDRWNREVDRERLRWERAEAEEHRRWTRERVLEESLRFLDASEPDLETEQAKDDTGRGMHVLHAIGSERLYRAAEALGHASLQARRPAHSLPANYPDLERAFLDALRRELTLPRLSTDVSLLGDESSEDE